MVSGKKRSCHWQCMTVLVLASVNTVFVSLAQAELSRLPLMPAPPQLTATSYLLVDANSGKVIVEKNATQPLPPASLTKILSG